MTALVYANQTTITRLSYEIDFLLRLALADRSSMRKTGAVVDLGSVNGSGSMVSREGFYGLDGYDAFAATAAEDTDVPNTSVTISTADISVARAAMRRDVTDQYVLTGPQGRRLDPMRLAMSMAGEWDQYFMTLLATVLSALTSPVGTSGAPMTVDDEFDAFFTLELLAVPGPFFELTHNRQFANWQGSLRGETGPLAWIPATAEMLKLMGPGYKGNFMGAEWFTNNRVVSSGGNRLGALWGVGAFGFKTGTMEPPIGAEIVRPDAEIVVEFQRDASKAITEIVGHGYLGMGNMEVSRASGIATAA